MLVLCLLIAAFASAHRAEAQSSPPAAGQWVQLASRQVALKPGRASFEVSKAKGSFTAVRVALRAGNLVLTNVEIRYAGGAVHRAAGSEVLRAGGRTRPLGKGRIERFVDTVAIVYRPLDTVDERAVVVIEGLQTTAGAAAMRAQIASPAIDKQPSAPVASTPEIAPPPPPPAPAPPSPAASAPPPTQSGSGIRGGGAGTETDLWDVVPVYYGTDRGREHRVERALYNGERARRLELGQAQVTVPKTHQVPKVERPWTYRLPFTQIVLYREREDPRRHFTLKDVRSLTKEEFLIAVRERLGRSSTYKDHALVFVHGFNVGFDAALFRTAQIAYDLKFDGAPFLYSWPSKGTIGINDYPHDRESSGQAEPFLRAYLEMIVKETGATSATIIAHSMGNQLLLPVLRGLKESASAGLNISQVIMAAPDVDRHGFENFAKEIAQSMRSMTLMAASNDIALGISRRFWGGIPRAGDVPATGPIVVEGVDTIDITSLSTELFSLNHSGYAEKSVLLSDIQALMQTGLRPPDKRVPALERIKAQQGDYWRYPSAR